jgi:hypothetical protein
MRFLKPLTLKKQDITLAMQPLDKTLRNRLKTSIKKRGILPEMLLMQENSRKNSPLAGIWISTTVCPSTSGPL